MVERRVAGEPLAWITGTAAFCGLTVLVEPGVYVPRWQSEPLARMAAQLLPSDGIAVDLCTGSGALAMVMQATHPGASVTGTEVDATAARCARRNGVQVIEGDLDACLPPELEARVDVMAGVLPYVPTEALRLLPRDVQAFEPATALDGGPRGLDLVVRAIGGSRRWVRPGGWLLLEVGGDQVPEVTEAFASAGYREVEVLVDDDGDPRGVVGCRDASPTVPAGHERQGGRSGCS